MTITTTQDICYNRLINLYQAGGESVGLNEQDLDNKIKVTINKGGVYTDNTSITGIISNLNLDSDAVFEPDCFQYNCFTGGGIWTTAIITPNTQVVNGVTQYWVEGSTDSNNNLWVLDIGYIDPLSGDFIIQDSSVPINNDGSFQSRINIYPYTKLLILKEVTPTTVTPILNYFGEYKQGSHISRSSVGYILNYNSTDQATDLEDISIGLLPLLFSNYKYTQPNQTLYYLTGELDPGIKQTIISNISNIVNLLDFTSTTNRQYSIPKYLATYLTPTLLYNDDYYLNNIVSCFDSDCFDSTCFESKPVYITTSREVSTRAIAWFYLLVYSYSIYLKDDSYLYILELIAQYLINQINSSNKLPSKGWSNTNILTDSVEITEYDLSTATVVYIALLKHYEYLQNPLYLEKATDIKEAIYSNLFDFKNKVFADSLSNFNSTIYSYIYGLIFSLIDNRIDIVENLVSNITNSLVTDYGIIKQNLVGSSIVYTNKLTESLLTTTPSNINFTTLPSNSTSLIALTKENTLLTFALDLASRNNIFISPKLNNYINYFNNTVSTVEATNSLVNTIYCFENVNPFTIEIFSTLVYNTTSNLSFQRIRLLETIISYIPTDYGWFSSKALSPLGNLFKILSGITKSLSTYTIHFKYLFSQLILSNASGFNLDTISKKYSFTRLNQEKDIDYKLFIQSFLNGKDNSITLIGLQNTLNRIGLNFNIKETYNNIFTLNTTKQLSSLILGEGYFSGEYYASTKIIKFDIYSPLTDDIATQIVNSLPVASIPIVNEIISIDEDVISDYCFKYSESNVPVTEFYILQETTNPSYIDQEDGTKIKIENSN